MYLIDSNVFLEILLDQEKSELAKLFFKNNDSTKLFLSDLSFYSIGISLFKRKRISSFDKLLSDIYASDIQRLSLPIVKTHKIKMISERFNLDFEDSYQYLVTKEFDLKLVTFDKDFDRTDIERYEFK